MSVLVDMNNLCHVGRSYKANYNEGLQTTINNCICFALKTLTEYKFSTHQNIYFCFDPLVVIEPDLNKVKSNPHKYKSGRKVDREVQIACRILYDIFKFLNFPVYCSGLANQQPYIEADDYIYNLNKLSKQIFPDETIIVLSDDEDLLNCVSYNTTIDNPACTIIQPISKNGKHCDPSSFRDLMDYPFNLTNASKSIRGCSSDRVPAIPRSEIIFKKYVERITKLYKEDYSSFDSFNLVRAFIEKNYPESLEAFEKNASYVYPKTIEGLDLYDLHYPKLQGLAEHFLGPSTRRTIYGMESEQLKPSEIKFVNTTIADYSGKMLSVKYVTKSDRVINMKQADWSF